MRLDQHVQRRIRMKYRGGQKENIGCSDGWEAGKEQIWGCLEAGSQSSRSGIQSLFKGGLASESPKESLRKQNTNCFFWAAHLVIQIQ